MASIVPFNPGTLRYEETLGFCQEVDLKVVEVEAIKIQRPYEAFAAALLSYKSILDVERAVHYSDVMTSDNLMDQTISGFRAQLKPMMSHPDPDVREAAKVIWGAIDQYGMPTQLPPTEEHPIVNRMLDALDALDESLFVKTVTKAWVEQLHERYKSFMTLLSRYDYERTHSKASRFNEKRDILCATWVSLCACINGLAVMQPSDQIDAVIEAINVRIQSRKNAVKQRKSARKSSTETASKKSSTKKDEAEKPVEVSEEVTPETATEI